MTVICSEGIQRNRAIQDEPKILAVMRFLESRGCLSSISQLELETGVSYSSGSSTTGVLSSISLDELFDSAVDKLAARSHPLYQAAKVIINPICATEVKGILQQCHGNSNPTAIAWAPTDATNDAADAPRWFVTGGADKQIMFRYMNSDVSESSDSETSGMIITVLTHSVPSPVLSLDWSIHNDVAVTCMGGEIVLLHVELSQELKSLCLSEGVTTFKALNTRVSTCAFNASGDILATLSESGKSVQFLCKSRCVTEIPSEWMKPQSPSSQLRFGAQVSSLCWITENVIAVAEFGNCMVGIYNVELLNRERSPIVGLSHIGYLCMNKHMSDPQGSEYTMLTMYFHSVDKCLVGCTSRGSVLVYTVSIDTHENSIFQPQCVNPDVNIFYPIKTLYGMSIGPYDSPSVSMSVDGSVVYVTSNTDVMAIDMSSTQKLFSIEVSTSSAIRCMRRHPSEDIIAAVAFDKQLSICV